MKSSHSSAALTAAFDDPNLIADAGLVPLVRLAERVGLPSLAGERLRIAGAGNSGGANPAAKVMTLVAAMCAGADSIDDTGWLRHGAMSRLFGGVRAPSTLGTFLRAFAHGRNRQLPAVHRNFLARLAATTPLLPDVDQVAFVDVDPTHRRVYGRAKQGAEVGRFKGVRTLHPILATLSTPTARPVIAAVRLRRGKAADARCAGPFTAEALATARQAGAGGTVIVRADSQFYNADVVAVCRRARAHFSLTVRMNPHIAATISSIGEDPWTPIRYPEAFVDPDIGEPVSDAEVEYTAFTGRRKAEQATGRLIVRRVRRLNAEVMAGQGELFTAWRYHPVFTDSPFTTLQAELHHRQHATVEQVIADAKGSAPAHLPSGNFQANNAWLTLWAIAHNLLRAAGALAGTFHARATTATLRDHLIHVPARIARSARRLTLHLPNRWPWQHAFTDLFDAAHPPPA
ncbi:IS1380 family transposase [Kitasatospora sp. NPDC057542]|uniref:IS1380 family transposase n=1 Tax=Streptomycetaceae TaxID=2062 RepID=UPI001CCD97ED|nr:IS1380 family transposase [Streptomyces sp. LS1784]